MATLLRTRGSTPRSTGARMAVRRDGRVLGTIGGGCGEAAVIRESRGVFDDGRPRLVQADLTEDVTEEADAACGGTMEVAIARWGRELLPVLEVAARAARERRTVRLLTCVEPKRALGAMAARSGPEAACEAAWAGLAEAEAAALLEAIPASGAATPQFVNVTLGAERWTALVEDHAPVPLLLICGGGHIAVPLCRMARTLDFEVVVVDDRPSFSDSRRFPEATRTVCAPFDKALVDHPIDDQTYAVVITHGHRHDLECVRRLLGRGAAYVGMIGSRRRVAGILDLLRAAGFSEAALSELHAPIGLDIGAETPAEIALAILAEVTMVRRGGSGRPLRRAMEDERPSYGPGQRGGGSGHRYGPSTVPSRFQDHHDRIAGAACGQTNGGFLGMHLPGEDDG